MGDSAALRQRRSRAHRRGDHSLCAHPDQPPALRMVPQPKPAPGPVWHPSKPSTGVLEAVHAELAQVGRESSYLGTVALALAGKIDDSKGSQGVPQLAKELRETMEKALAGATQAGRLLELRKSR